jgi:orotate phosphoribosyltransferase
MIENGLVTDCLDAVLGVPEGAAEIGREINRKLIEAGYIKDKLYLPRIVPKEHGNSKARFWVNGNVPGLVVPFEDTVTTGDSIFLKMIDRLRESGVRVEAVLGMVDRLHLRDGFTVEERFEGEGLKFYSMTDAKLLLPELVGRIIDPEERIFVVNMLNREFQRMYEEAGRESPIDLEELK